MTLPARLPFVPLALLVALLGLGACTPAEDGGGSGAGGAAGGSGGPGGTGGAGGDGGLGGEGGLGGLGGAGGELFYDAAELAAIASAVAANLQASRATGVQLAVWHGGSLVHVASFGSRDPEGTLPVDDATLFQIGSDTKKMTALVALQQVEAGRLRLDSSVSELLPPVALALSPEWAPAVTLHHLISHQGGLWDFTPWAEDPTDGSLASVAAGEFSESVWAMSDPGAFWNYANPNFSIAGLMVEQAAGRPWPDVVEQDLFAPLGMTGSFARREAVVARGNYATGTGYRSAGSPFITPVPIEQTVDNGFLRPAGLVWSTASDMATFGAFYLHGNPAVLADEPRQAAVTQQVRLYPAIAVQGYGYGWILTEGAGAGGAYYDVPLWMHGGNTLSMTSLTWVLPEQDLSISILSNGFADSFEATAEALVLGSGLLPAPSAPPDLSGPQTDHARLAGTYADHQLGPFTIASEGGVLLIEIPGAAALGLTYTPELTYSGYPDVYLFEAGGATYDLTFVADSTGAYAWVRNRGFVGRRVLEPPPGGIPPSAPMPQGPGEKLRRELAAAQARATRPWFLLPEHLPGH